MAENPKAADPTGIAQGFAKAEPFRPDLNERELAGDLQLRFDDAHSHRLQWEYDWEFNRNYLRGDQLMARNRDTGETTRITLSHNAQQRLFSIENLLRPYARALVGKLTRIIPGVAVMPATDDESDLRASQVAETFLEFIQRKEQLRTKYLEAQYSLTWAGTSVFQLNWNKTAGRTLAWCSTCNYSGDEDEIGIECPACTMENEQQAAMMAQQSMAIYEQGMELAASMKKPMPEPPPMPEPKPAPILEKVVEGDIEIPRLDVRDFYPEPGVTDPRKWRYTFVRRAYPVSELRRMFPHRGKHVVAEDGLYTDKSLSFFGTLVDERAATQYLDDHAYLYEYHEAASQEFPNGRLIYYTQDIILEYNEEHPVYKLLKRLPFFPHRFEHNEGEFWGEPPISQCWHIQRERNRLLTQMREHRELTLRPKLLNPKGNRIGVDEIDTTPGQILPTSQFGRQPAWLEIPGLPQYAYEDLIRMDQSIARYFGLTENEIGQAPSDNSGRLAAIQESQASEAIAPIIVRNNEEWKELHRGTLLVAQHYYNKERTWTITGRERVRSYAWGDVNLQPGWDVSLEEDDSLSRNPAIRFNQANELWAQGIFIDPRSGQQDVRTFMRVAGLKLPGVGPDVMASEHAYAASIPERIMRGEQIRPRPWDDPFIMVEELVGWLRGAGRQAPEPLVMQVAQWYMFYSSMLPYNPVDMYVMPNAAAGGLMQPGQEGQGAQAGWGPGAPMAGGAPGGQGVSPGGSQNQPVPGKPQQEAQGIVKGADQHGERLARGATRHEG